LIILDTNVLSAVMQRRPPASVLGWLDAQAPESVWVTSVTLFEARFGLAVMDDGRRKSELQEAFEALIQQDLAHRVAVFDSCAADRAAVLAAERRRKGRPVDIRDTFIAGIALAHGAALATRNIRHFEDLPVPVINPWDFS
jgi:predicted nucleic acid-binding protein